MYVSRCKPGDGSTCKWSVDREGSDAVRIGHCGKPAVITLETWAGRFHSLCAFHAAALVELIREYTPAPDAPAPEKGN